MTKRNIIVGVTVVILAVLAIGLFFLQRSGAEGALRRTIINNQDQARKTATELQRSDRITTVWLAQAARLHK
jgi:hypothetical protein